MSPRSAVLLACGIAGCVNTASAPGDPKEVLDEFVVLNNSGKFQEARRLIYGTEGDLKLILSPLTGVQLSDIRVARSDPYLARLDFKLSLPKDYGDKRRIEVQDHLDMVFTKGRWKILQSQPGYKNGGHSLAAAISYLAADPKSMDAGLARSQRSQDLTRLRDLAMAILLFSNEHGNRLPNADKWTQQIEPYLKSKESFTALDDPVGTRSYAFNAKVAGKTFTEIRNPGKTILVYSGLNGQLRAEQNAIAQIAFCDGRAINIQQSASKTLQWDP